MGDFIYHDSVGRYDASTLVSDGFDYNNSVAAVTIVAGVVGATGNVIKMVNANPSTPPGIITKNLQNLSSFDLGCNYLISALPASGYFEIMRWQNAGVLQCLIAVNAVGAISFWLANQTVTGFSGATKLGESPNGVIVAGVLQYIETAVVLSHTGTGTAVINVNGPQVLSIASITNTTDSTTIVNQFSFLSPEIPSTSNVYAYFCDINVRNDSTISGRRKVGLFPTTGVGMTNAWAPVGAATNWQGVTATTPQPDGDTTYASANAAGLVLACAITAPVASTGISVQAVAVCRTDDGGTAAVQLGCADGATIAYGSAIAVPSGYGPQIDCFGSTNPITGIAWTAADMATLQAAIKRQS